jgi:hypothetical protein
VAPCGVEGLSCADCPASQDRLFGGGCQSASDECNETCSESGECSETCNASEKCAETCNESGGCSETADCAAAACDPEDEAACGDCPNKLLCDFADKLEEEQGEDGESDDDGESN